MAAEERWYDAHVDATLGIPRGWSVAPTSFFDLRVRWEYTVTPRHRFRKFAVISDRQRYDQLVAERGEQWWLIARQLGLRLQRARIAKGLSQEALAHAAGISTYTYQKFEKGESRPGTPMNPRLRTFVALAAALDMQVELASSFHRWGVEDGVKVSLRLE